MFEYLGTKPSEVGKIYPHRKKKHMKLVGRELLIDRYISVSIQEEIVFLIGVQCSEWIHYSLVENNICKIDMK